MGAPMYPGTDLFERAKALSLIDFLDRELGIKPKQRGRFARYSVCPNSECRAVENRHSERLMVIDDHYFRCWRCGTHGSIIDAAMLVWACDTPKQAALALLGEAEYVFRPRALPDPLAIEREAEQRRALLAALQRIRTASDRCSNERGCLAYLCNERKLPESIVREAQRRRLLGFLPCSWERASALLREQVGDELLEQAGLWDRTKYGSPWIARRPLVFFFPGMTAAEFRLARAPREDEKKSLQRGSSAYPWFWKGRDPAQAIVVEGFIDLLSTAALGYSGHILGLAGCSHWDPAWFPKLQQTGVKRLHIGLDNDLDAKDNPGQTWAGILADYVSEIGLEPIPASPARGDMNELLKARGRVPTATIGLD